MPKLTGTLKTITERPSAVREVLLRAPRTRTSGKTVIVDEPVRIAVDESGDFTATVAPGAAVLVLIGADFMARESVPLLVAEGMSTVAEAMEAAVDFTPEVHDRLAELAADVARGVKSTGEAAKSVSADREKVEKSAAAAEDSASVAGQKEASASSAWQQMKARLEAWEPKSRQLEKWQPQYEWLKENAEKSFAVVQEKITQATDTIMAQVRGDAESAKRDAATAGQHSLKALAASKTAESAAQSAVDTVVKKLLDGAPQAYDTLKEVADELSAQKSAAAALMRQISEKAQASDLAALRLRVESLAISGVSGLSQALAGKANVSHQHRARDITDLDSVMSSKADKKHTHSASDVVDFTAAAGRVVASAIGDRMGSLRLKAGTGSDPNTIYFEV
ncbi:hypothetical protein FRC0411_00303 [Corynebacterium diphtheriae]|uniref:hypothetical protein n=1 Tax=Corynebacterium diphtheriae TaxID=1717 RepID=UPI0013CD8D78|nr:hypothetical protein [Corynebacterium diphtheriae]MBG9336984.1 hypothetical protein [Corynebacterium diphtheriae bv. gravis]CAB0584448.1 hypothetical protein CIP107545_00305 [Corynebacterium diphtheriae]CAB0631934.1 hypothetical protein CIP107582_00389 [Corynebacterium diphtheriae]CAB0745239.1 hypothetical protein FRC0103_02417 [Corynebacterium diphtheriae]CAB0842606.1 hypothetical protein FRC0356_00113 [Corynebacterium diphtheriae]